MADSIPGNATSTQALVNTSTSTIDFIGDADWWKVYLVYGYSYQIFLRGSQTGGGTLSDPYLGIYNDAGVFQYGVDDIESGILRDSYTNTNPDRSGYFFLGVRAYGSGTGTYSITIVTDQLSSAASAAVLNVNSISSDGKIGFLDDTSDWYGITLIAGVQYQFDLIGSADDGTLSGLTVVDPYLILRNSSGALLRTDDDSGVGQNARILYTPNTSGKYFLDAQELVNNHGGIYRIIVNSAPTNGILTLGASQGGSIGFNGDIDRYSVTLAGGVTYGFALDGLTLVDPYLEVLDGTGASIFSDNDGGDGLNAYVTYTPTSTGTYYLAARESGNDANGTYTARVWELPTISISDAMVTEENSGWTNMVFAVALSAASPVDVTVAVSTSGASTATTGIDFSGTALNVRIAAGQTTATFLVPVLGDFDFEPTEVFYATLSGAAGAVADRSTALGRIVDNDSPYVSLPTDSLLKYQWHLFDNTGINVFPVWSSYTGRGVRVAVFDWGIDATNPELNKAVLTSLGVKASDLSSGGAPILTSDNHGTAVAGVIAAAPDGRGTVGVAFNAKLVSIYNTGTLAEIANAFTYAKNFDVLNNSWGMGNKFFSGTNWAFLDDFSKPALSEAAATLKALADNGRGGLGTVVVQSAGNAFGYGDDTNLHNFQNSRYIITVGATDYAGSSASYSSPGSSILVSAPGGDGSDPYQKILTADRTGANGYSSGDYAPISGTSFSSPIVAGVVALMLEANPGLGYRDIQEILAYSARSTDVLNNAWRYNSTTDWNGGGLHYDAIRHDLGFGLVDAVAAVRLAETWTSEARNSANVLELSYSSSPNVAIPDYKASSGAGSVFDYILVAEDMRIERVEVSLKVTHTWVGDLYVLLTGPTGTTSFLISRPGSGALSAYGSSQENINFTLDTVLNWGESAKGLWQIGIFDEAAGSIGTLDSWTIKFIGSPVVVNNTYFYTNEFSEATADQSVRATLIDSSGIDTLNASAVSGNLVLNLGASGVSSIDGRSLTLASGTVIENAYGGDGNDVIYGGNVANALNGMRGEDTLDGGTGNDALTGGLGADIFVIGAGTDTITDLGNGADILNVANGATANATIFAAWTSTAATTNSGVANISTNGLAVNLGAVTTGTVGYNITNAGVATTLTGSALVDVLIGGAGDDTMVGGLGNDTLNGGAGSDSLGGGDGTDTAVFADAFSSYSITWSNVTQTFTVVSLSEGTDSLSRIEFIKFSDVTLQTSFLIADTTAPTVTTFSPADEATAVAIGANIVLTFSEAVQRGSGNIVLKTAAGAVVATYDAATSTNLSISGSTLTINPSSDLGYSTDYKVEFAAGSIKDVAGNSYAGVTDYNFTTGAAPDTTAPTVTTFSPADEATAVAIGANIVLTFSETVVARSGGTIELMTDYGSGHQSVEVFSVSDTTRVTISGNVVTIDPTSALLHSTGYHLGFNNALADTAGNAFSYTHGQYNFTTGAAPDTTAPTVTAFSPADEAKAVAIGANIVLTFSEAVQRGTGNIVLKTAAGEVVATYDAASSANLSISGSTLTINPSSDLGYSTGYKVEFAAGSIKDIAGNSYAGVSDYNFTTVNSIVNGTSGNDSLVGTIFSDGIFGLAGNDTLNGGAENDTLTGGVGNDTFVVGAGTDSITDLGNGRDILTVASGATANATVFAALTATAATTNSGVANITTNGLAVNFAAVTTGTAGYNVTNTGAATKLTGSALDDTLTGGIGNDSLVGGMGNDTYVVDSTTDLITELLNGGTDTLVSSVTQTSLAGNVENLSLSGTADINATGNTLINLLNGNAGNNTLNGGTGADTMLGGAGNDTYVVDNSGDMVYESTTAISGIDAGGTDTVQSSISYSLAQFVENLTLTGKEAINATGNTLANTLVGNAGNNTLHGGLGMDFIQGGGGADLLYGGIDTVKDVFDFNAVSDSSTKAWDKIYNFLSGADVLDFSGIDSNSLLAGDQVFSNTIIGKVAANYSIWTKASGADLFIRADTDGISSTIEFQLQLMGVTKLAYADVVL